jgi:hypothetical protein
MLRNSLTLVVAAALAAAAAPALAQDDPLTPEVEGAPVSASRVVRQDFEPIGPVTTATNHTVGSEQLELTETLTCDDCVSSAPVWTSDSDRTSSRVNGRASSTHVIRACEISLTVDGDCTAP